MKVIQEESYGMKIGVNATIKKHNKCLIKRNLVSKLKLLYPSMKTSVFCTYSNFPVYSSSSYSSS